MSYLGELRQNLRPLAAASLGSGSGLMLMSYATTIFGPYLVKEFGWSRSQFALIGLAMVPTLIVLPIIGRLTDHFGVKRTALVGAFGIPLSVLGYSLMSGSFTVYFLLSCSLLILGSFTTPVVYTRLIAADFKQARGLALTIVTISPALLATIGAPLLTEVIDAWGFRTGYRVLALFILLCSLAAVALIPAHDRASVVTVRKPTARADYRLIFRSAPFWIIFAAMLLCTLQTPLHASQMGMMLRDNHLGSLAAATMISVYSIGTVIGRISCGLALDKFPAPIVAAVSMFPPAVGYALLATPLDTTMVIGAAMFMVGVAIGAEGDLQSYLVARHFDLRIFSTTLSLVYVGVFAAGASGSALISLSLKLTDSFAIYLAAMAGAVALGSSLFLLLPREGRFAIIGANGTQSEEDAAAGQILPQGAAA